MREEPALIFKSVPGIFGVWGGNSHRDKSNLDKVNWNRMKIV